MDKRQTTSLKGICAILMLLHHISLLTTFGMPFQLFSRIGCLVCAEFFLLSGYGIYLSFECDETRFMKGFGKRILKLTIPFVLLEIINIIWLTFDGVKYQISIKEGVLFGNWFFYAILLHYTFLGLIFVGLRKFSFRIKWSVFFICVFLLNWWMRDIGWGGWWYNSSLAFPAGILVAKLQTRENCFAEHKLNYLVGILSIGIYVLMRQIIERNQGNYWIDLLNIVSSVFFAIAVAFFYWRIHLPGKVWKYLGEISYEIYLMQFVVFHILQGNRIHIVNNFLFAIIAGSVTILFSGISNYIFQKIYKLIWK